MTIKSASQAIRQARIGKLKEEGSLALIQRHCEKDKVFAERLARTFNLTQEELMSHLTAQNLAIKEVFSTERKIRRARTMETWKLSPSN